MSWAEDQQRLAQGKCSEVAEIKHLQNIVYSYYPYILLLISSLQGTTSYNSDGCQNDPGAWHKLSKGLL
jgi:hypothetical protein